RKHQEQAPPVGSHNGLERMFEVPCQGLSIAPEQLRQKLEAGGNTSALACSALTPKALRLTARTLALMRYTLHNDLDQEARRQQVLTDAGTSARSSIYDNQR
ncbi:MAG: hypothetical protein M3120_05230, partial [Pseudomonadota bacterium]|nr:hypothetical protein [Pseudomonadota bacterium]